MTFCGLIQRYTRPYWLYLLCLVVLTLLANVMTTMQPLIVSGVMETILDSQGIASGVEEGAQNGVGMSPLSTIFDLNQVGLKVKACVNTFFSGRDLGVWGVLAFLLCLFFLLVLTAAVLNYVALVITRYLRMETARLIRRDVLQNMLSLDLSFFYRQKSGEVISRLIQDAQNTGQGLGPLVRSFLHQSILIVIYSIYLFCTNVWLTAGAVVVLALQFGVTQLVKRPIRETTKGYLAKLAQLSSSIQEMLTSIRVIKSFGAEGYEQEKLDTDLKAVSHAGFMEGVIRHIEPHAREVLDNAALIGIIIIAASQLMSGRLSIGGFLLYIYVGKLLITPINKFSVNFTWAQALMASFERLNELFSLRPTIKDGNAPISSFKKELVFDRVDFSYDTKADFSLDSVSLEIKKGQLVALVGPSGAGKSTITDLLLRFYDPKEGRITIDGVDLKDLKGDMYRKLFGVVPQESLLFNDTIVNNIAYGREGVSEEAVVAAAKVANAHEFILSFPDGYNTMVGDRGVRLSGGQRQRIAIARAIVTHPEMLVLDEATSSLDSYSEHKVQKAMDTVMSQCTAVVIAHRLSTVLHADMIIVMDDGKVQAKGTHKELLKTSSLYKKLYEKQFGKIPE